MTSEQIRLDVGLMDEESAEEEFWRSSTTSPFSDEAILESAVRYFRESGFPYRKLPLHVCMQEVNRLAATPLGKLLQTHTGYHVADTYHPHRFRSSARGMKSPFDSLADEKLLRRALKLQLDHGRTVSADLPDPIKVVSGTQSCSNFRPGYACYLYRRFCSPGDTVLDTSTGYGGRLVGFFASGIAGKYIGIDPATETYLGNRRMTHDFGMDKHVHLIHAAAEDVAPEPLRGVADFAFTSPPYFNKEIYSQEETQSWKRYPTPEEWRCGFLVPMLRLQVEALRPDRLSIINIEDVNSGGERVPLVQMTIDSAKEAGFIYEGEERFVLREKRFGRNMPDAQTFERVLIFRKPESPIETPDKGRGALD